MKHIQLFSIFFLVLLFATGCSNEPQEKEDVSSIKLLSTPSSEQTVSAMPESGERIYLECKNGEGHLCIIAQRTLEKLLGLPVITSSATPDDEEATAVFSFENVERTMIKSRRGGIITTLPDSFKVHIMISTPKVSHEESVFLFRPTIDTDALYQDVRGETENFIDAFADKLIEKIQEN